ncbi:prepilin-type N-terminal cleavage/methylation domain-containing protein [bacterium]|nr:prepilin-type N-terminal cleavage/methylation domain-containing protein [bacterium]
MQNNKKAFTMAEVLVCMTIIGVVMAFSVNTIRIVKASYTSLTYFSFNNIQAIVGSLIAGDYTQTEWEDRTKVYKDTTDNLGNQEFKFTGKNIKVYFDSLDGRIGENQKGKFPEAVGFCKVDRNIDSKDANKVVTVLKNDREYDDDVQHRGLPTCGERSNANYVNNTKDNKVLFCHAFALVSNSVKGEKCMLDDLFDAGWGDGEPELKDFNPKTATPNIITTNGQRYYISKWKFDKTNVSPIYGYRLIAVDLNGKSGPNLAKRISGKNFPDVVTFMVMDNGEVFPLGHAADNVILNHKAGETPRRIQYITSSVYGYYMDDLIEEDAEKTSDKENWDSARASRNNKIAEIEGARDITNIPAECKLKMQRPDDYDESNNKSGWKTWDDNSTNKEQCNFARVQVENPYSHADSNTLAIAFTYREAYCYTHPNINDRTFKKYCTGVSHSERQFCPPSNDSSAFDSCKIVNIKPMFRYNFK